MMRREMQRLILPRAVERAPSTKVQSTCRGHRRSPIALQFEVKGDPPGIPGATGSACAGATTTGAAAAPAFDASGAAGGVLGTSVPGVALAPRPPRPA